MTNEASIPGTAPSAGAYVRALKVFGSWLAAEELAQVSALRSLRKPRVPDKLVEPIGDDVMRRLLAIAGSATARSCCCCSTAGCGV